MDRPKEPFWKLDSTEILLHSLTAIITIANTPAIIIWAVACKIAYKRYQRIYPTIISILTVLILQGLFLVYYNIKRSINFTTETKLGRIFNFIKLQFKTLIIHLLMDILILVGIYTFIYII